MLDILVLHGHRMSSTKSHSAIDNTEWIIVGRNEDSIVRALKVYATGATLMCGLFLLSAFRYQENRKQKFEEIDVERINIVEKDGKLRMVISNRERQHPGMVDGKVMPRPNGRPPGMIFFNQRGDEADFVTKNEAVQKMPGGAAKDAAMKELGQEGFAPERISIAKLRDKSAMIVLSDAKGKPRIRMSVEETGNPRLEFLDEAGRVTYTLPVQRQSR